MPRTFDSSLPIERQKELLNESYYERMENYLKLTEKTLEAQKGKLDKVMLYLYYSIRNHNSTSPLLTNEEKYQLGIGNLVVDTAERQMNDRLCENMLQSIVNPPTIESFRDLYLLSGILDGWTAHQIGKENKLYMEKAKEIVAARKQQAPLNEEDFEKVNGRNLTEQLGDFLTVNSDSMANHINRSALDDILGIDGMQQRVIPGTKTPENPEGISYYAKVHELLEHTLEAHLQPHEHPTMTAEEFCQLVKMDDAAKQDYYKKQKLQPGDSIFDHYLKSAEQAYPRINKTEKAYDRAKAETKKAAEALAKLEQNDPAYQQKRAELEQAQAKEQQAKTTYIEARYRATLDTIVDPFFHEMEKAWRAVGRAIYEKGLQESEKKDLQNGVRLSVTNLSAKQVNTTRDNMKKAGIDVKAAINQISHENILKNIKAADEAICGGKPLNMRRQYGISQAVYADNPKAFDERAYLTSGVLSQLEGMESTWKYHSKDSATYTNFLTALKNYRDALRTKEGGKANDLRKEFIKACGKYVEGKESLRSHPNAQKRFDLAMALLYKELKPETFQKLIDRINEKRGKNGQVTVEDYAGKARSAEKQGRTDAIADHNRANQLNVTTLSPIAGGYVLDMDMKYGYPKKPEEDELPFPPVGAPQDSSCKLNSKDYSAVVFASSLSSNKRTNFLDEDSVLNQNDKAIADGRKVAEAAFKAYGGQNVPADKIPLAKLLTAGIQKINEEMQFKQGVVKECLTEMAARMANMLDRDPQLKMFALREGLKEEDLPARQKEGSEQEREEDRSIKRSDSLISLS